MKIALYFKKVALLACCCMAFSAWGVGEKKVTPKESMLQFFEAILKNPQSLTLEPQTAVRFVYNGHIHVYDGSFLSFINQDTNRLNAMGGASLVRLIQHMPAIIDARDQLLQAAEEEIRENLQNVGALTTIREALTADLLRELYQTGNTDRNLITFDQVEAFKRIIRAEFETRINATRKSALREGEVLTLLPPAPTKTKQEYLDEFLKTTGVSFFYENCSGMELTGGEDDEWTIRAIAMTLYNDFVRDEAIAALFPELDDESTVDDVLLDIINQWVRNLLWFQSMKRDNFTWSKYVQIQDFVVKSINCELPLADIFEILLMNYIKMIDMMSQLTGNYALNDQRSVTYLLNRNAYQEFKDLIKLFDNQQSIVYEAYKAIKTQLEAGIITWETFMNEQIERFHGELTQLLPDLMLDDALRECICDLMRGLLMRYRVNVPEILVTGRAEAVNAVHVTGDDGAVNDEEGLLTIATAPDTPIGERENPVVVGPQHVEGVPAAVAPQPLQVPANAHDGLLGNYGSRNVAAVAAGLAIAFASVYGFGG